MGDHEGGTHRRSKTKNDDSELLSCTGMARKYVGKLGGVNGMGLREPVVKVFGVSGEKGAGPEACLCGCS